MNTISVKFMPRVAVFHYAEALKWLRKAADHGDAHAQSNLAVFYAQGFGVPKDEDEAAKWMRRAADQGLAAGQFGLGSMYAHGRNVELATARGPQPLRGKAAAGLRWRDPQP